MFPSGKTQYLYSQIEQLIFSDCGALNLGGCFAALEILNSSVCLFIAEETVQQMKNFLMSLIENKKLQELFVRPLKLHPNCKKIVYLDLKLSYDTPLKQAHVQRFLLQAFFSSNGQMYGEGNCYTIAPLLNCLRQNPEALLTLVRDVLEAGFFKFEEIRIDVPFFMNFTEIYEQDFQSVVNAQELVKIDVLEKLKKIFPYISSSNNSLQSKLSLEEWIESHFGNHTQNVKEVILSYKLNYLQHLMFGMLQWIALNSNQYVQGKFSPRLNLAMSIGSFFFHSLGKTADQISPTVFGFFGHMMNRFGLVETKNLYYTLEGDRIFFPYQKQGFHLEVVNVDSASAKDVKKGRRLEGDLAKYVSCFNGRSLYFYNKKGEMQPVEKISEFVAIIRELFEDFLIQFPDNSEDVATFKNYLAQLECRQHIAQCIATANFGYTTLSPQDYYFSDSFFLLQNGASAIHLLFSQQLAEKFAEQEFSSKDEKEFFINLCSALSSFYSSCQTQKFEMFTLVSSPNHIFNLYSNKFSDFLDANPAKKVEVYLEQNKAVLERVIDDEEKKKILEASVPGKAVNIFNKIPKGPVTIKLFRKQVYFRLDTSLHEIFDNVLDDHIRKINLKKFRLELVKLLEALKIQATMNNEMIIEQVLENAPSYILPYELAKRLQKAIYKKENKFFSISSLEHKIAEMTHIPSPIQVGNLNWVPNLSEDLKFSNITLRYHFGKERLIFVKYVEGDEAVLSSQVFQPLLEKTKLFLRKA